MRRALLRGNQGYIREVGFVPLRIARQKRPFFNSSLRANKKIWQHAGFSAVSLSVLPKGQRRNSPGFLAEVVESQSKVGQEIVEFCGRERMGDKLRKHHHVDADRACGLCVLERRPRPMQPIGVCFEQVDQHIGIDQGHGLFQSSPRVMHMSSSVLGPPLMTPIHLAKGLAGSTEN